MGEKTQDMRPKIEEVLRRFKVRYELRTAAEDTVVYMVTTPKSLRTDRVSNAMMELMPDGKAAVEWNEKQKDKADGWDITYERITPKWAAYSGVKDGLIRYMKAITVCDNRAAFLLIDYDRERKLEYDPIITRMEKGMQKEGC